jgi:hypothetical protein
MWNRQSVSIISSSRFLINRQLYFLIDTSTKLFFVPSMVLQRSHLCYLMSSLLLLSCFWADYSFSDRFLSWRWRSRRLLVITKGNNNVNQKFLEVSLLGVQIAMEYVLEHEISVYFSSDNSFLNFWFSSFFFLSSDNSFFLAGTWITPCWYHCFL